MPDVTRPAGKVWVLEPSPGGHRLQYARALIDQANELGWASWLLTSSKALASAEFAVHFPDWGAGADQVTAVAEHDRHSFCHRRRTLQAALRLVAEDDLLVLPEGDHAVLPWLTMLRHRCRFAFLIMRAPAVDPGAISKARWKQLVLTLGRWRGARVVELISALAPAPAGAMAQRRARDLLPQAHFPSRLDARYKLGLPADRPVFLLAGVIDDRKSPAELLAWIDRSASGLYPVLLVVGAVAEDCKDLFNGELARRLQDSGRLVLRDGYVDEEILRCAYAACDGVMLLYRNDAPSGAVAFSAVAQRPIVAWNNRSICADVTRLGLGVVTDDCTPAGLDAAVGELMRAPAPPRSDALVEAQAFFREITGLRQPRL